MIGQTISHYQITEELGRGGMGVVYKARDTKLKRTVALKFLSPHLLTDPKEKARFLHEAQAAAALDHPNISTIHEVHEADGHTFMVMAFIEGEDVGAKIGAGAMTLDEALDIAVQVAKGLSKAHESGIVHRDIKPGNVIVTNDGVAKVVDFGLAKLATQTKLTKTGTTVGTVRYMSPEQATGGEVDHRTDIWSLGVMLYEMLAGTPPFRGDVEPAMVYSILNEDPKPVTETRKEVPVALEDIVERALAKDPTKRFDSMQEFLTALETQRDQITLGIKERRFTAIRRLRRRKRLSVTIATVLVVGIAAILAQIFYEKSMAIDSIAVLPLENLTGDPEKEYFADGVTEELITRLGRVRAVNVISRQSVKRYKGSDLPLAEIASELRVDAVVEGSIRLDGDRVFISATLVDARRDRQIWANTIEGDIAEVMSLQSQVAQAVSEELRVTLTAEEQELLARVREVDPRAHDAYLKGRYFSHKWTEESMTRGLRYFQDAIEIDPTYALAYTGLADCYVWLGDFGYMEETYPKAKAAAKKAVELDPSLGWAHAVLAWIRFKVDRDCYGPEEEFRRAVDLSPNDPDVRMYYDQYLTTIGRYDEAIVHSKRAVTLDPLTASNVLHLAWIYEVARRFDDCIEASKAAIELDPSDPWGQLQLAGGYSGNGLHDEAVAAADSGWVLLGDPNNAFFMLWVGVIYGRAGLTDKAEEILETVEGSYGKAMLYGSLGRTDEMFEQMEKLYNKYDCKSLFHLQMHFGEYRDDPRYKDLARRMGMPDAE